MTDKLQKHGALLGILLIVITQACFAGGDASAKYLSATVPFGVILGLRYVFSFTLFAGYIRPWRDTGVLRTHKPVLQFLRAAAMLGATGCSFGALHWLTLTQNTSVIFTSPLFIAALSGPLLGETLGVRRILAVLAGFVGVLVITRPGAEGGMPPAALLSLGAAVCNALTAIITRRLAGQDRAETTMFYSTAIGSALVAPLLIFSWAGMPTPHEWQIIALMTVMGTLGHWLMVLAHRHAPASVLAPFFYTQLLFALAISFAIFHNVPDVWTILGGGVIAASGLYLVHRERVRRVAPSTEGLPIE